MSETKTLAEAVQAVYDALHEAEQISLETGESFYFEPAYGMGGVFNPNYADEDTGDNWHPSSLSC